MIRLLCTAPLLSRRVTPVRRVTTFRNRCAEVSRLPGPHDGFGEGFYLPVHPSELIERTPPASVDEGDLAVFREQTDHYQRGTRYQAPPVFLAGLPDASVLTEACTVASADNHLLADSFWEDFLVGETGLQHHLLLPRATRHLRGGYAVLGILWWKGYYHWLLDVLPRLAVLERFEELRDVPLIVPPGMSAGQRESLRLLGIAPERLVEFDGGRWTVERLYFPSPLAGTGNPSPHAVGWLRERFSSALGLHDGRPWRRLYVSRRDAPSRRVVNEEEIAPLLSSRGFELVCPGSLSFAEQARLFSEAAVVVGPHGAGLTNLVFTRPGATVVEVFPEHYANGCYWALANVCGHRYGFMVGAQRDDDVRVDPDKLSRLLDVMGVDGAAGCTADSAGPAGPGLS